MYGEYAGRINSGVETLRMGYLKGRSVVGISYAYLL